MGSLWGNPIAYTKTRRPVVTYNKRAYSCKPPTLRKYRPSPVSEPGGLTVGWDFHGKSMVVWRL
jgi:hypothetical protein